MSLTEDIEMEEILPPDWEERTLESLRARGGEEDDHQAQDKENISPIEEGSPKLYIDKNSEVRV